MGKLVTVKSGFTAVPLPPQGRPFNAGQTQTLTDAEYAALPVSTTRAISLTSSPADPARPVIAAPVSLADAVTKANAYTDTQKGVLTGTAATTAPSAGGGSALPATPTGYLTVTVNGTPRQIAYY